MRLDAIFLRLSRKLALAGVVILLGVMPPDGAVAAGFTARSIADTSGVNVMEVEGDYAAWNSDGSANASPREIIAREFYKTHPDRYDFLVFFANFDFPMPKDSVAFYLDVRNNTRGLGLDVYDNSSRFGSGGVLQGTIDMGNLANLASDPFSPLFSDTMGTLSHELLHRWGPHLRYQTPDGKLSSALLGQGGAHWSFLLDTKGSLEYGNNWLNNGDGTFTSFPGRKYFSPLDLYLMGLIDKTSVPPHAADCQSGCGSRAGYANRGDHRGQCRFC